MIRCIVILFLTLISTLDTASALSPLFTSPLRSCRSNLQTPPLCIKPTANIRNISPCQFTHNPTAVATRGASELLALKSNSDEEIEEECDPLVQEASVVLRRVNWFSWWSQVILTVISSITLIFARNVLSTGASETSKQLVTGGFFFAGSGISLSFLSIIWTWGGTRLSRRLRRRDTSYSTVKVANMIRRTITIGTIINLIGMFVTLIGAQQIVGLLASKLLSMQGVTPFGLGAASVASQTLQPLDILIVQANTNTLLSHFISLFSCLLLTRTVKKLDPPSIEADPR